MNFISINDTYSIYLIKFLVLFYIYMQYSDKSHSVIWFTSVLFETLCMFNIDLNKFT